MARRRRRLIVCLGLVSALATTAFLTAAGAGARPQRAASPLAAYPRSQTLITSGTQWGNIAGMNPYVGNYAAGMVGLVNETLLRFDPIKNRYIAWLAKSASWTGPRQYTVVVRSGVKWADGKPFTGRDVAFNVNLGRFNTAFWNNLWANLKQPISVKGDTVVFTFKTTPNYVQWQNLMWNLPMISPAQGKTITSAAKLTTYSPRNPIGTGPYQLDPKGYDPTTRVVWVKKAHWWAADQGLSPSPAPKYIIDLVNTSNTNALSGVLSGIEDLNNNYLPGVEQLVDQGKVHTYYSKAPYMLSANTAWLEPNTTHKPLNDPVFRRALAMAINVNQIVKEDYHNLVLPANPSGLLPTWRSYIDKKAVAANGFRYNPAGAEALLTKAGYKKDGSGMFENKDGSRIDLEISVPQGWSDWEAARDMIVASAKQAGIRYHRQGEGLQHLAERPEHRQLRPRHRQQLPALRQPVDVLERHLPPPDHHLGHRPDVRELRALQQPAGVGARPEARQDPAHQQGGDQGDQQQAADDPDEGSAPDPTLVQRRLGADDDEVLEGLARRRNQPPVRAGDVARLPADDGYRRDHAPRDVEVRRAIDG